MFSRRASSDDLAAGLANRYPGAPAQVVDELLSMPSRPRRGEEHVAAWVEDQVRRSAARVLAAGTGLAEAPYPPDGEESLRVYLPTDIADDVGEVPPDVWEQARGDAWSDHGDELAEERELWWAEALEADVDAVLAAWRRQGPAPASG
jgi:hypothetical protein